MQYNCCNPAFGIRLEIFVVHSFRCRVSCSECITIPSLSSQTNDMQFTCCTFLYQLHKNCSRLHNIEAALKVRKTKLELELEVEDSSWVKVRALSRHVPPVHLARDDDASEEDRLDEVISAAAKPAGSAFASFR